MYSPTVEDHFHHPRNAGEPSHYNAKGVAGDPNAGPFMVIYLLVADGWIKEAGFQTFGCPAAIAAGSVLTEMVKNHCLEEAHRIDSADVLKRLGGLPLGKRHCSNIAVSALIKAIEEVKPPGSGSEIASKENKAATGPMDQTGPKEAS